MKAMTANINSSATQTFKKILSSTRYDGELMCMTGKQALENELDES